jgi:hypothetical protein
MSKSIKVILLFFVLVSCSNEKLDVKQNGKINSQPKINPSLKDIIRREINDETWEDFSNFSWDYPSTWGTKTEYYGVSPAAFLDAYRGKFFGLSDESFEGYTIKGDGECWLRATLRVLFHNIFSDDKLYQDFFSAIDDLSANVVTEKLFHPIVKDQNWFIGSPWMKGFPWEKFKQGIMLLKENYRNNKYLNILNHHNVDWFFIASFRALASFDSKLHSEKLNVLGFDHKNKRYKSVKEIEQIWENIIADGTKGKLKELACDVAFHASTDESGKEEYGRKFCSRASIIEKLAGGLDFTSRLHPWEWDDPRFFSQSLDRLFKYFTGRFIIEASMSNKPQIIEFGLLATGKFFVLDKCLQDLRDMISIMPIFYDFYSELLAVYVNKNHYDVLIRKPTARFDYENFYRTITDDEVRHQIKLCIDWLTPNGGS